MGHTAGSFTEADYLQHLLGGIEVSAGFARSEGCDKVDPNAPIVEASATPTSGQAPLVVDFTASATDPNGTAPLGRTAYRWEFGDGSSAFGANQRHRYTTPGTYDAVLTVTDPERKSTDKTIRIIVHPQGGQAPVVEKPVADPGRGPAPLEVRFEAAATDPDGPENQLSYRWDFGDNNGIQFGRVVRHTYMEKGVYFATVRVTDAAGVVTTSAQVKITVDDPPGNKPPNAVEAAADPLRGTAPLPVQFSSHPTDPDGDTLVVTWDFGDGGTATGAIPPVHTYTAPGVYVATVTVRDPGGLTATDTVSVTVNAPAGSLGVAAPPGDVVEESAAAAPVLQVTRSQSVARVVRRGLRFTVACDAACSVSSALRIAGGDRQRLGRAAASRIGAGDSRRLVLRLDRNVRSNLVAAMRKAKLRNLRATLVLKIRTAEGTTTVRKAVVLRR
jgi:PKD repeat protein